MGKQDTVKILVVVVLNIMVITKFYTNVFHLKLKFFKRLFAFRQFQVFKVEVTLYVMAKILHTILITKFCSNVFNFILKFFKFLSEIS